uniref:Uncharacterized protein n=1 Tax=Brassica oleracea var. oleracea TaxID=109376 RepID=A0A0D3CSR3_BRAOL
MFLRIFRGTTFLGIFRGTTFLGIFRGTTFLGIFRGTRSLEFSSKIPRNISSELLRIGPSESPSKYPDEVLPRYIPRSFPTNWWSSEICFLEIPSENSEGFPRKNEFPRSYLRGLVSSFELEIISEHQSSMRPSPKSFFNIGRHMFSLDHVEIGSNNFV